MTTYPPHDHHDADPLKGPPGPGYLTTGLDEDLDALRVEYERETAAVLRLGARLTGVGSKFIPQAQWETEFEAYNQKLSRLRDLGEALRPARKPNPAWGASVVPELLAVQDRETERVTCATCGRRIARSVATWVPEGAGYWLCRGMCED